MLTRTLRVTMGANASPDLDILTIWDPFKALLGKVHKLKIVFTIDIKMLVGL